MNLNENEYIIMELIPTKIENGDIVQLSALKLKGIRLIDRFDYRLDEDKIVTKEIKNMINYDKNLFTYKKTTKEIMDEFKIWVEDLRILYIDNSYTKNYIEELPNDKESIHNYLNIEYSDDVIEKIIKKYNLEPSNYIVDLLYESLIQEI